MLRVKKIFKEKDSGQAFFEFIFFLPIMVILLAILISIGGSINGAINQQKITRAYFFSRAKNNSTLPTNSHRRDAPYKSWRMFGMFFIGWMEEFDDSGERPRQPCYKMRLPLENKESKCDSYQGDSTNYVRVGTVFGICGTTYERTNGTDPGKVPLLGGSYFSADKSSCTIIQ